MGKAVQFSIGIDNTAGTLADLCKMLRKSKVNIEAISVSDNTDCGWVRIIATPSAKARAALAKGGYLVCAQLVVTVKAANKPGELERIAGRLAKVGVNISYVYGSCIGDEPSMLVLGVSDVDKAVEALDG
jgi:hypothetical protein